jgi:hypothetical protein
LELFGIEKQFSLLRNPSSDVMNNPSLYSKSNALQKTDADWVLANYFHLIKAMGNLFDMLRPGGAMLLSLAPNHWIFDIHEKMAESTKWRRYMDDIQT